MEGRPEGYRSAENEAGCIRPRLISVIPKRSGLQGSRGNIFGSATGFLDFARNDS
jgi:hypothetical protein